MGESSKHFAHITEYIECLVVWVGQVVLQETWRESWKPSHAAQCEAQAIPVALAGRQSSPIYLPASTYFYLERLFTEQSSCPQCVCSAGSPGQQSFWLKLEMESSRSGIWRPRRHRHCPQLDEREWLQVTSTIYNLIYGIVCNVAICSDQIEHFVLLVESGWKWMTRIIAMRAIATMHEQ